MQRSFGSFAVGWACQTGAIDSFGLLELARELSYPRVQLGDNCPLHTLGPKERERLREKAREYGVQIEVGMRGLWEESVAEYIEIARMFGSEFIRLVIDAPEYEPDLKTITALLRKLIPRLQDADVILALENHDRFKAAEFMRILEQAASPHVAICLDSANSLGAGEGIEAVTKLLSPYVVNVHLKDIRVERLEHKQGFVVKGTPLGQGQIPVEWLLREIGSNGRCVSATLEHWAPLLADMEETVILEREWCRQSTLVMRRLCCSAELGSPRLTR